MEHHDDESKDPHSFRLPLSSPIDTGSAAPTVNAESEKGILSIAKAFANDGFVVLRDSLDTDRLGPFQEFANRYFDQCFRDLYEHGHIPEPCHRKQTATEFVYTLPQGTKHGFREIVMRSPGRYEVSLLHHLQSERETNRNNTLDFFENYSLEEQVSLLMEPLQSLLPHLVGPDCTSYDDLKLCHLSLLVATQGSSDQSWHADGGHVDVTKHLPCHCFNVFVPLQDTPHRLGPTQIRPSSHFLTRNLGPMMLAAKCRKTLRAPVWPELFVGDVLVFDYRVLHRGRANRSAETTIPMDPHKNTTTAHCQGRNRNFLVLSFSEPWFEDLLNFPKRSLYDPKEG